MTTTTSFLALTFPPSTLDELAARSASLQRTPSLQMQLAARDCVPQWQERDRFHLTVRFFPHCTPELVDAMRDAAKRALKPIQIAFEGLGVFKRERVLHTVASYGADDIETMVSYIWDAAEAAGEPPPDYPVHTPHVTLARSFPPDLPVSGVPFYVHQFRPEALVMFAKHRQKGEPTATEVLFSVPI